MRLGPAGGLGQCLPERQHLPYGILPIRCFAHPHGQVVGETDKDGVEITDRELGVMDLVATMTQAMGIDLDTQYTTPRGRPMKVVDAGQPIAELF